MRLTGSAYADGTQVIFTNGPNQAGAAQLTRGVILYLDLEQLTFIVDIEGATACPDAGFMMSLISKGKCVTQGIDALNKNCGGIKLALRPGSPHTGAQLSLANQLLAVDTQTPLLNSQTSVNMNMQVSWTTNTITVKPELNGTNYLQGPYTYTTDGKESLIFSGQSGACPAMYTLLQACAPSTRVSTLTSGQKSMLYEYLSLMNAPVADLKNFFMKIQNEHPVESKEFIETMRVDFEDLELELEDEGIQNLATAAFEEKYGLTTP
jgi:hypothetical protein